MNNYGGIISYPAQPGLVGISATLPGAGPDLMTYSPMQPTTYAFGGGQYGGMGYPGPMMSPHPTPYPTPVSPVVAMNPGAAAVRTSVGPQTEGRQPFYICSFSLYSLDFLQSVAIIYVN
jgi:hypothetical protein